MITSSKTNDARVQYSLGGVKSTILGPCLFQSGLSFAMKFNWQLHTVSFDWFLSGLEWIHIFEFCLIKLLIFYQKSLWNIRSRLNSSTFWVFEPVFRYVWSKLRFLHKKWRFWSNITKYRLKNSKWGRVKPRSDIP